MRALPIISARTCIPHPVMNSLKWWYQTCHVCTSSCNIHATTDSVSRCTQTKTQKKCDRICEDASDKKEICCSNRRTDRPLFSFFVAAHKDHKRRRLVKRNCHPKRLGIGYTWKTYITARSTVHQVAAFTGLTVVAVATAAVVSTSFSLFWYAVRARAYIQFAASQVGCKVISSVAHRELRGEGPLGLLPLGLLQATGLGLSSSPLDVGAEVGVPGLYICWQPRRWRRSQRIDLFLKFMHQMRC